MEWVKAVGAKTEPPDKIGFIYMLAGDTGTTNHDLHQRDTHKHWVQTGPHVMIVGPRVRERHVQARLRAALGGRSAMAQNSRQQKQSLRCIPARSDTLPEAERNLAPAPGHV
jgi:hypothetical protein